MSQLVVNKQLVKFLLITGTTYIVWLLAYEFLLKPSGKLDSYITENITYFICFGLDVLGVNAHYTLAKNISETYVYLGTSMIPIIRVGASCNGLELLVLFCIFTLFYPGKLGAKLLFIAGGLVLIHITNIFRNLVLTIMAINKSPYFDLFHRYIFIFLVYGVIFLLWIWWANKQQHHVG